MHNLKICVVCNNINDDEYENLRDITEPITNTSVINIKRNKSNTSSVRAGARYLLNQFNLKYLGFIVDKSPEQVIDILEDYLKNLDVIIDLNKKDKGTKQFKTALFKGLFSVTDYLAKIA